MSPRPFTALATALALAAAALIPLWPVPTRSPAAPVGANSPLVADAACCGDQACCESGGACGTDTCAGETPGAPEGAPASVPSDHSAPVAGSPIPSDCPRFSAGCGGGAPAVLASAFDPMVCDDAVTATGSRTADRAAEPAAPAPRALPRDPQEPPPRA